MSQASRGATIATGVGFFVLGGLVACAAALVSRFVWRPDPVSVPWGMVVAVGASASVVWLARAVSRTQGVIAAVGWLVGLGYVVKGTSGGGFLIASDGLGWGFLILGTVAALGSALWGQFRP